MQTNQDGSGKTITWQELVNLLLKEYPDQKSIVVNGLPPLGLFGFGTVYSVQGMKTTIINDTIFILKTDQE